MLDIEEDEIKKLVLGIGIGMLVVMVLWIYRGAAGDAFGSFWYGIGLTALACCVIGFAVWWIVDW